MKKNHMKFLFAAFALGLITVFALPSCKKQVKEPNYQDTSRTVRFLLYTDKDFSNDPALITFKAAIQTPANQVLWDSTFTPMPLKSIPGTSQKIVIEKKVPGNNPSLLKVGFYYSIENVGNSWYIDSFKVGETLKIVDFNFQ